MAYKAATPTIDDLHRIRDLLKISSRTVRNALERVKQDAGGERAARAMLALDVEQILRLLGLEEAADAVNDERTRTLRMGEEKP